MAATSALDLRQLQHRLTAKAPDLVYALIGAEDFLVREAMAALKAHSVEEGTQDFNCDFFEVGDCDAVAVRDAAEMLPMMSRRRLVMYRGVERLKDKDWEALYPVLDNPVPSTTLVLIATALDKRKKFYKKVAAAATLVELKSPYENQVADWINFLATRLKIEIQRDAVPLLQQFVGVNLTELNNELTKLRDFLEPKRVVSAADVLEVISRTRVDRVFDLTDAIGRQDKITALGSLANLLDHGQNEVGVLAMISRHFRILAQIKDGQKSGLTGQKLAARAGVPPFLLGPYLEQTRHWDSAKIRRAFAILLDTDRALKSSPVPAHVWLENFVLKTCS